MGEARLMAGFFKMKILEMVSIFAFGCFVGFMAFWTFGTTNSTIEEEFDEPAIVWGDKEPQNWKRAPTSLPYYATELPANHKVIVRQVKNLQLGETGYFSAYQLTVDDRHRVWVSRDTQINKEPRGYDASLTRTERGLVCDLSNSGRIFELSEPVKPDFSYAEKTDYIPILKIKANQELTNDNK